MRRRSHLTVVLAAMLVAGLSAAPASASTHALPASMAAVGDSITQAASSGGSLGADYPANSWSTGTSSSVNSHYQRLLTLNPAISGNVWNHSVSGAKVADLAGQMAAAAVHQPAYLTVLIGGNDLCTDTVDQMTPVATFRDQFAAAMSAFTTASQNTAVYVVSIPNAWQLWNLFRNDWWARTVWSLGDICQSLLANPTSTQTADVQRRAAVAQRNVDFNTQLAQVCAGYTHCRWDGNAVYNTAFATSDVSGDYFHPSTSGQAKLAAVSWDVGPWANAGKPTIHLASATGSRATGKRGWTATVTASAADAGGAPVSGATISGTWSTGAAGSCVTSTSGSCSFSVTLSRKVTSVTWTVASVSASGHVYDASANQGSPVTILAP